MEEIRTNNKLAQWVHDELSNVPPTTDEKRAEAAIEATAKSQYYKDLPSIRAIKNAEERRGVMDSYDAYFNNYTQYFVNYAQNRFMGYAFLSYLAQDAMISRGIRVLADEMTREWGEITSKDQESEEVITELYADMDRLNTQDAFRKAAHMTGFFGGCLVFLDVREDPNVPLEDEELAKPLFKEGMNGFNESKLKGRYLVGLRPIEPINISPGVYNSTDPTAPDFFEPEHFYILGHKIHRSRFLYFADNIPPQVLKPVYLFFGVPLAQLAFNYVQEFYKAKDVCSRILQKFSCSAISTDVEKLIATNGQNSVKDRVSTIAKYRDNDSIIVLDKENEEFSQVNTPISGLKEMWYAHLEQIPMIFGEPATKLLEISPSGFNSTGEFEMRSFYDSVHTKQSNQFSVPMKRLLDILCFINGFDPAAISWNWKSLYKLSEREAAEVNKIQADTDQVYYNMGVIGNDDIAKRLIEDKDSGYNNIEVPERIDPFQQEESPLEAENGTGNPDETEPEDVTEDDEPKRDGLLNKLKGLFDADRWITIHPPHGNKEDKGVPLKIGEDGEVKAGAGGRFTGKKINTIKKEKSDIRMIDYIYMRSKLNELKIINNNSFKK